MELIFFSRLKYVYVYITIMKDMEQVLDEGGVEEKEMEKEMRFDSILFNS